MNRLKQFSELSIIGYEQFGFWEGEDMVNSAKEVIGLSKDVVFLQQDGNSTNVEDLF